MGRGSYVLRRLIRHWCSFATHMSPALNGSSVLQCFEHGNTVEIHNGIMFDFYLGLPHMLKAYFGIILNTEVVKPMLQLCIPNSSASFFFCENPWLIFTGYLLPFQLASSPAHLSSSFSSSHHCSNQGECRVVLWTFWWGEEVRYNPCKL